MALHTKPTDYDCVQACAIKALMCSPAPGQRMTRTSGQLVWHRSDHSNMTWSVTWVLLHVPLFILMISSLTVYRTWVFVLYVYADRYAVILLPMQSIKWTGSSISRVSAWKAARPQFKPCLESRCVLQQDTNRVTFIQIVNQTLCWVSVTNREPYIITSAQNTPWCHWDTTVDWSFLWFEAQ